MLTTSRRTQAERRDQSERRLLDATAEVVSEDGVSAATFEAIGRRAGYSRGLAAQKFGSKRGLIDALIADLHDQQELLLAAHHLDDQAGYDAVLDYVDQYLRHLTDHPASRAYFMLLAGAVADASELRTAFERSHDRVKLRLAGLIRRGQVAGDLRGDLDPEATALMVGSLLLGVSVQWLVDPAVNLDAIRRATLSTLRAALLPSADKRSGVR